MDIAHGAEQQTGHKAGERTGDQRYSQQKRQIPQHHGIAQCDAGGGHLADVVGGGAAAHNIGQMAAACITLGNTMVLGYLPFLLAVSLVTGTLTGFVAGLLFRAMRNIHLSH